MEKITVSVDVAVPKEKVWHLFTEPDHVMAWNHATDDWHSPSAKNDLRPGGIFSVRMEAKDGSFGFDFGGTYIEVVSHEHYTYKMDDARKVTVTFSENNGMTTVTEVFDPEKEHEVEFQRAGWQSILDNFKRYAESQV